MSKVTSSSEDFDVVIEPGRAQRQYWLDLWQYRELLYFLSWRDVLVRYKQTALGIAWSVIRPVLMVVIFTFVFGRLARMPAEGLPYSVLVFAAMLPWQLFSTALTECSNSLIVNANLVSKVYFPRLLVPASAVAVCVIDFLINTLLLAGMMIFFRVLPGWSILMLPVFLAITLAAATGAGLWLAALNVTYRDFRYVVPFLVQVGLYISPVGFSSAIVPEQWRTLYRLNPMVGVIEGFRWSISGGHTQLDWVSLGLSLGIVAVIFGSGLWFFRRTERSFADVI